MDRQHNIWKYLRGSRVGKEANRLEREALSDPFLYEALEGLTGTEGEHVTTIGELQRRIGYPVKNKKKVFLRKWWAVAALLILGGVALQLLYFREAGRQMAVIVRSKDSIAVIPGNRLPVPELAAGQALEEREEIFQEEYADRERENAEIAEITAEITGDIDNTTTIFLDESRRGISKVKTVEGVVRDAQGRPLAGVAIMNGKSGIATDENGHFRMKVSDTARLLTSSFIGMKPGKHFLPDSNRLHITMLEDTMRLEEAVVGAHSSKKQGSLVAACAGVRRADWENEFQQYAADSLRYPADARQEGIEGDVILAVHFNRKGRLGRIKVVKKLFPSCNREAVRLVQAYRGPWNHGKGDFTLTIKFSLQGEK